MYYMGIIFGNHKFINFNSTIVRNPPEVIPLKVYQHDMFRPLLFIQKQFLTHKFIFLAVPPSWSGASNWSCLNHSVFNLQQSFGRRTYYLVITKIHKCCKRRWIYGTQYFVETPRAFVTYISR